jgi:hypothetical protein
VLPESADVAHVPALELAYYVPAGTLIGVTIDGVQEPAVPLDRDGWLDVGLEPGRSTVDVRVTDPHGHSVVRTVRLEDSAVIVVD